MQTLKTIEVEERNSIAAQVIGTVASELELTALYREVRESERPTVDLTRKKFSFKEEMNYCPMLALDFLLFAAGVVTLSMKLNPFHWAINLAIGVFSAIGLELVLNKSAIAAHTPIGVFSGIYTGIRFRKFKKEENARLAKLQTQQTSYDVPETVTITPSILNQIIDYLARKPIKEADALERQIDESIKRTTNGISDLNGVQHELQEAIRLSSDDNSHILLSGQIDAANRASVQLNAQLQNLQVQRTEVIETIKPLKEFIQRLKGVSAVASKLNAIQDAFKLVDENNEQNDYRHVAIHSLKFQCQATMDRLIEIQGHIGCIVE